MDARQWTSLLRWVQPAQLVSAALPALVGRLALQSSVVSKNELDNRCCPLRLRGRVRPDSTCSSVWRQRESFFWMDSTVAIQTKGRGCSFHAARKSAIALSRSSTLWNEPRRMLLEVNSRNQRSIRFSQLELVGTKWGMKRGCRASQAPTFGCLWVP